MGQRSVRIPRRWRHRCPPSPQSSKTMRAMTPRTNANPRERTRQETSSSSWATSCTEVLRLRRWLELSAVICASNYSRIFPQKAVLYAKCNGVSFTNIWSSLEGISPFISQRPPSPSSYSLAVMQNSKWRTATLPLP